MRIMIGGATGFLGQHLVKTLEKSGNQVSAISRTAGAGRMTWKDLNRHGLPKGCDAVVNLAGENLMNPLKRWNEEFRTTVRSSRIDTTQQIVQAIRSASHKPKVWISASAIGFYKSSETVSHTEDEYELGDNFFSQLCQDWEEAAALSQDLGVRHVVIRIGLVLGRDGGIVRSMYAPFFLGLGGRIASGRQWFPWIHVTDVTGIIMHALSGDHVSGPLNAVAPQSATNQEFTKAFAGAMHRPALFPVPQFALSAIYGSERSKIMVEGQKVVPRRTLETGYKYQYPTLESACKECAS